MNAYVKWSTDEERAQIMAEGLEIGKRLGAEIVEAYHRSLDLTPDEAQIVQAYALSRISRDPDKRQPCNELLDGVIYWRQESQRPAPDDVKSACQLQYEKALFAWRSS